MSLIKLTRQNGTTVRSMHYGAWELGTRREIAEDRRKPELYSDGVLHAYRSVELALLINPIMGNIDNPKLWSAVGDVVVSDFAKVGCYSLTIAGALELPEWYTDETKRRDTAIMFAILCAEAVLPKSNDSRLRKAVAIAKQYLQGGADAKAKARLAWTESDATLDMRGTDIMFMAHYMAKAVAYPLWTDNAAAEVAFFASRIVPGVDFDELARQAVTIIEDK